MRKFSHYHMFHPICRLHIWDVYSIVSRHEPRSANAAQPTRRLGTYFGGVAAAAAAPDGRICRGGGHDDRRGT